MRTRLLLFGVWALVLAACGGGAQTGTTPATTATTAPPETTTTAAETTTTPAETTTTAAETTTTAAMAGGAVVTASDSDLGTILVDAEGMTLYVFDNDTAGESTCYDQCAETWPPLLTEGDPQAEGEVDASLLGTTSREDGSTQVTYNGLPLYYFEPDEAPGDVMGQGVGDIWWVIGPDGQKITE